MAGRKFHAAAMGYLYLQAASMMLIASRVSATTGGDAAGFEIRFCPTRGISAYPADEIHHVNSLLLQNVAILNRDRPRTRILSVEIDLLEKGTVIDRRTLGRREVDGLAKAASQLNALRDLVPFQFCGTKMLSSSSKLSGPILNPGEALLVLQEPFSYTGTRDMMRVAVHGVSKGRPVTSFGQIVVRDELVKMAKFPLRGVWYAANAPTFHTAHRWTVPEEFAYDMIKVGPDGQSHSGDGTSFTGYYAYGAAVFSMSDGRVVDVVNDETEDPSTLIRPGESKADFATRLQHDQDKRLRGGARALAGNYVIIDQGNGYYGLYAHLRPGSAKVHVGEAVHSGQQIGSVGSSGNSTEPHLHFQLCLGADPLGCEGMPMRFSNIELPLSDNERAIQTGDFIRAW